MMGRYGGGTVAVLVSVSVSVVFVLSRFSDGRVRQCFFAVDEAAWWSVPVLCGCFGSISVQGVFSRTD